MLPRIYYGSRYLYMSQIKESFPDANFIFIDNIDKQLASYSPFFDLNNIYLYDNPNTETIKKISYFIDKKIDKHILLFDDDGYDGRSSLIQKIKKSNNIYSALYPVFGDSNVLRNLLYKYAEKCKVNFDSKCIDWVLLNCPIIKVKNKTSKKEVLYYDIDLLFQEIDKVSIISSNITVEHFSNSKFNVEHDIFEYFKKLFNRDISYINSNLQKVLEEFTTQGFFLILLQQLYFLLVISECQKNRIYSPDKVQEILELRDLGGKYLSENYEVTNFQPKNHNPIRIKIALNENNLSTKQLSEMISLVTDHIGEARLYGESDVANMIAINKLANV